MRLAQVSLLVMAAALCACCADGGNSRPGAGGDAAGVPSTGWDGGPGAALDGASESPVPDATSPSGKPSAGLRLSFEEPSVAPEPGRDLPLKLKLEGKPGLALRVRLFGADGVALSGYTEETPVALDASGRASLGLSVRAPRSRGGYVVARVTTEDGRVQESHCLIGGREPRDKPGLMRMEDGRGIRVAPSR